MKGSENLPIGAEWTEAKECPEMLSVFSPPDIEVHHIATDADHDTHCAAMHSSFGLFTPDSKRFIFHRQLGAGSKGPGKREFLLCEIDDGFKLRRLTDEDHACGPILSLEGQSMYYWVDNSGEDRPHIVLKQIDLDTFRTETLLVVDGPVEGVGRVPRGGYMYDKTSIRHDGKRLAASCSFYTEDDPLFATIIVDLEAMSVQGFIFEPYNWRPNGLYYRGDDPQFLNHMLMGRSHMRSGTNTQGKWYSEKEPTNPGFGTLHIVTDEGEQVATVPIGDQGEGVDHPTWRGGKYEVVTHTSDFNTAPHWRGTMLCAEPVACAEEDQFKGAQIPGAKRFELTRKIRRPDECHHSWDQSGTRVVADTEGWSGRHTPVPLGPSSHLWIGTVVEPEDEDPYVLPKHLLHPRSSWTGSYWTEVQPAMSPDCKTIFFNSDWLGKTGHPQVFCVQGHSFP